MSEPKVKVQGALGTSMNALWLHRVTVKVLKESHVSDTMISTPSTEIIIRLDIFVLPTLVFILPGIKCGNNSCDLSNRVICFSLELKTTSAKGKKKNKKKNKRRQQDRMFGSEVGTQVFRQ